MKIKDIINSIKMNHIDDFYLKLKMILMDVLDVSKEYLLIHEDDEFPSNKIDEFNEKIEKLKINTPIQYIINKQDFYGLEFYVDENVLIPQPDTEILVEECINIINNSQKCSNCISNNNKESKILDLCTGSGAIGISIAKNISNSNVFASDISEKALEIARKNAENNNVEINFIESNLFENIKEKFNMIVSNPPYIETETIKTLSEEVKKEPIIALDGGVDGLNFYRKIAEEAKYYLKQKGYLALEIGYNQKHAVEEILKQNYYKNIYSKKDLGGNDRIVVAQI